MIHRDYNEIPRPHSRPLLGYICSSIINKSPPYLIYILSDPHQLELFSQMGGLSGLLQAIALDKSRQSDPYQYGGVHGRQQVDFYPQRRIDSNNAPQSLYVLSRSTSRPQPTTTTTFPNSISITVGQFLLHYPQLFQQAASKTQNEIIKQLQDVSHEQQLQEPQHGFEMGDDDDQGNSEDDRELCICRQIRASMDNEEENPMIGCDVEQCQRWYHLDCVGITQEEAKSYADWTCP